MISNQVFKFFGKSGNTGKNDYLKALEGQRFLKVALLCSLEAVTDAWTWFHSAAGPEDISIKQVYSGVSPICWLYSDECTWQLGNRPQNVQEVVAGAGGSQDRAQSPLKSIGT